MAKNSAKRLKEIVKVSAFYGFGFIVDNKIKRQDNSPENLRLACEDLGPTFIKLGQILSTRPDILPAEYIRELSKLQDNVLPERFKDINKVIKGEFGKSIEDLFLKFNEIPLASASVAQVHEATLKDGREVIVKVQRPDIAYKMEMDISILSRIFNLTKAKFKDTLIDPTEALNELLDSTRLELDFNIEAENIEKFRGINKLVTCVYAPFVINEYSGRTVLTLEKIDGYKISDREELLKLGYDLPDISKKLALSFLKNIFEDGFFHADPHPGNLLIRDGKICFIDFGIIGKLNKTLRDSLNDAVVAVAYQDINKLISVFMSIGIKSGFVDRNQLYEDIDYLFANYLNTSFENINISYMLQEVFDVARRNNIKLPKELTLVIRTFIILEGVIAQISPEIKVLDIAIPYVKSHNLNKDIDLDEVLLNTHIFLKNSVKVPTKLIEVSDSILSGRTKIKLELKSLDKPLNELNRMVNRMVFGLVVSAMIVASSLVLNSNIGPKVYDVSLIGVVGFIVAGISGLWLLISILRSGMM
ncbi:putative unusual protein kinase [Clostridium putrefaciens]|uniref:Putative unusual protein kinase n=1 Tax=Clostridium putrefaciens TaxID=99675 RepID=A0A381J3C0_9CLOT|nr:AarF/ABC1/UbiB kinase family protein [Clostridium putrefaciens]SUY44900.1 putative unusual protein kinase [Clostridium putrefaciens]